MRDDVDQEEDLASTLGHFSEPVSLLAEVITQSDSTTVSECEYLLLGNSYVLCVLTDSLAIGCSQRKVREVSLFDAFNLAEVCIRLLMDDHAGLQCKEVNLLLLTYFHLFYFISVNVLFL